MFHSLFRHREGPFKIPESEGRRCGKGLGELPGPFTKKSLVRSLWHYQLLQMLADDLGRQV